MSESKPIRGTVQVSIIDGVAKISFAGEHLDNFSWEYIAETAFKALRDPNTAESSIWKLLTPEAQATPRSLLHGDALDAAVDKLRGVVR